MDKGKGRLQGDSNSTEKEYFRARFGMPVSYTNAIIEN